MLHEELTPVTLPATTYVVPLGMCCVQDNPESESKGWKRLSSTPELNFLSQIVLMLFEDESAPADSLSRYYINLHIGSGVKARKQSLNIGMPFIDGEIHSPSFVKRLPTVPVHRASETNIANQTSMGVRKVASFPSMIHTEIATPLLSLTPPQGRSSDSVSHVPQTSASANSSPDSPGRKFSLTYSDAHLQTMGEPGEYSHIHAAWHTHSVR